MNICVLDGKEITDKGKLHDVLAASLNLPEWYGRNLDALYDCLTEIREGTEVRICSREALEAHLGKYTQAFLGVLKDAAEENPLIRIIFC